MRLQARPADTDDARLLGALDAHELDDIHEQCDGVSPAVFARLVRERMQRLAHAAVATDLEEPPELNKRVRELGKADWRKLVGAFDGACAYCGSRGGGLRPDRLVARALASLFNAVPACAPCAEARQGRYLPSWLAARPDLDDKAVYARLAAGRAALRRDTRLSRAA